MRNKFIGAFVFVALFLSSFAFAQAVPTGSAALQATGYQAALAHARTTDLQAKYAILQTDLQKYNKDLAGARGANARRASVLSSKIRQLEAEVANIKNQGIGACNDLAEVDTQKACIDYFTRKDVGVQERLIDGALAASTRCRKKDANVKVGANTVGGGSSECDPNAPASPVVLEYADHDRGYRMVIGGDPERSAVPGGNLDPSIGTWKGSAKKTILTVAGSSLLGALSGYALGEHFDRRETRANTDGSISLMPGDGSTGALVGWFAGAAVGFVVDMATN